VVSIQCWYGEHLCHLFETVQLWLSQQHYISSNRYGIHTDCSYINRAIVLQASRGLVSDSCPFLYRQDKPTDRLLGSRMHCDPTSKAIDDRHKISGARGPWPLNSKAHPGVLWYRPSQVMTLLNVAKERLMLSAFRLSSTLDLIGQTNCLHVTYFVLVD